MAPSHVASGGITHLFGGQCGKWGGLDGLMPPLVGPPGPSGDRYKDQRQQLFPVLQQEIRDGVGGGIGACRDFDGAYQWLDRRPIRDIGSD